MKYNYPHTGNDKLMFQERFWSPAYVASNGGTVTGSLSFNGGATFDGTAKYIDYLRRDHGFPAQWTMMADINLYDLIGDFTILSRDATSPTLSQFCVSVVGGRLKVTIGWTDGTYSTLLDQINHINVGIRQHVAVTYDGVTVRTFVCGVAGSTLAVAGKKLKRSVTAFRVGARASVGYENYFKGTIKELRVYGTALALSDFQALWLEAQGEGAALSIPPVLDGLVLWIDPRTGGTPATQPTIPDADMEAASAWPVLAFATASKETTSPYQGTRCSKIVQDAGIGNAYAGYGGITVAGNRYVCGGAIKTSNVLYPAVVLSYGGGTVFLTTNTTDWAYKVSDGNSSPADLRLGIGIQANNHAGEYGMIDALSLINMSRTSITPSSLGSVTAPFTQATAASQPWVASAGGKQYLRFATDIITSTSQSSSWKFLHDGSGFTGFCVIRPNNLTSNNPIFYTAVNASSHGIYLNSITTNGVCQLYVANGSGVYAVNKSFNWCFANNSTSIMGIKLSSSNGLELRKNGISIWRGDSGSLSSSNPTNTLSIGNGTASSDDNFGDILLYNRELTEEEIKNVELWLGSQDRFNAAILHTDPTEWRWLTHKTAQSWVIAAANGYSYTINWGDGTSTTTVGNGVGQTITHNFSEAGPFIVSFSIADRTKLIQFNTNTNGLVGPVPSPDGCPALVLISGIVQGNCGTIPSLSGATALVGLYFYNCQLSGYTQSILAPSITNFQVQNNLLPASAVNQILADFVTNLAVRPNSGTIRLDGTGNAAPTGQGLIDKQTLIDWGWTVTTN